MTTPDMETRVRRQDARTRQERAHRILDTAGELLLRWGYDKTTIDDVARSAGVAKGTIYLHWKSREELFTALLRRDRVRLLEQVRDGLARRPGGVSVRELFHHLALGLARRPLVKAVLLGDVNVLGKLIHQRPETRVAEGMRALAEAYLRMLRGQQAVRTDLSLAEQANVIGATLYGFFLAPPHMPADHRLPEERTAQLLADTLHRALAPGRQLSPHERATVAQATLSYLEAAVNVAKEQLELSLTPPGSDGRART
ncbi:TetR family transcriptional regulator [Sphaerisporangium krabiense]|uniref:AcrR family transcriptional regulator n=1 Tax=Sphaerisporangium krabiense TaxID=763782 RepID=A0A7W8Z665_9ACTN|nr:TetR/AcrR family transcriptional regulator [Sphaerisporangium krabiense]MBB5628231.1 AcrR family transcriptional regulator [Sphaerisporangium krabiense]GII66226.1 TetR family transcriptional regulator [Sphaerisporangium krabiense]